MSATEIAIYIVLVALYIYVVRLRYIVNDLANIRRTADLLAGEIGRNEKSSAIRARYVPASVGERIALF